MSAPSDSGWNWAEIVGAIATVVTGIYAGLKALFPTRKEVAKMIEKAMKEDEERDAIAMKAITDKIDGLQAVQDRRHAENIQTIGELRSEIRESTRSLLDAIRFGRGQ